MSMPIFFVLNKSLKKTHPRFIDEGLGRYINISFY